MSLVDSIAGWIRGEVEQAGACGVVVGLSGGIDSATVAALSVRALEPDCVLGVVMPVHSQPEDLAHAKLAAETLPFGTKSPHPGARKPRSGLPRFLKERTAWADDSVRLQVGKGTNQHGSSLLVPK